MSGKGSSSCGRYNYSGYGTNSSVSTCRRFLPLFLYPRSTLLYWRYCCTYIISQSTFLISLLLVPFLSYNSLTVFLSFSSLLYREIITAPATMAMAQIHTTTRIRMSSLSFIIHSSLTNNTYRDGSYYYANPNGSTYYNSGNGYSRYTSPSGQTRHSSNGSGGKK